MKRREFLRNSVIGLAVVGGAVPGAARGYDRPLVLVEGDCVDAALFAGIFSTTRVSLRRAQDPTEIVAAIQHDLGDRPAMVVGLTRPSGHFLVEQLATLNGYRELYSGVHDYSGRLTHRLQGPSAVVMPTADVLDREGTGWAAALARQLLLSDPAGAPSIPRTLEIPTTNTRPSGSTGLLLSWSYARGR